MYKCSFNTLRVITRYTGADVVLLSYSDVSLLSMNKNSTKIGELDSRITSLGSVEKTERDM